MHCHIIPNVDDGPHELLMSLEMANTAVKAGITHLFATPHHMNGRYDNTKTDILEHVHMFNKHLQLNNVPLTVHPGQEIRIHRELFLSLEHDELLTLGNRGKFILLELPSDQVPSYTQNMVYELLLKGITPIIVHPERNRGFIENQNLLFNLVQEGALSQLTSGSINGQFGKKVKSFSEMIIEHNLAHFIATDAHNIDNRGFSLQEAYESIRKKYGINQTFFLKKNAELLMRNQNIIIENPVKIRKKILGIF
ncbi:tyrosine-protein phosphatase [Peribacillus sp. NPDC097198]|uniref:tyrosine-protein phosphatase n=1 Tax=Peribacillus sp. NPDC097198 TaxID=3364397 RepID=UPI0038250BFD